MAPATIPGPQPQPRQSRRHCTVSTDGAAALRSDDGAVIGAAPAGTANVAAPTLTIVAARSLQGIFMTHSPQFFTNAPQPQRAHEATTVSAPRSRLLTLLFRRRVHIRV